MTGMTMTLAARAAEAYETLRRAEMAADDRLLVRDRALAIEWADKLLGVATSAPDWRRVEGTYGVRAVSAVFDEVPGQPRSGLRLDLVIDDEGAFLSLVRTCVRCGGDTYDFVGTDADGRYTSLARLGATLAEPPLCGGE